MRKRPLGLKDCLRRMLVSGMIALGAEILIGESVFSQENASGLSMTPKIEETEKAFVEIRLRAQAELDEPIVRLGHVAELYPTESPLVERLAQIELFPSPAPGQRRYLSAMETEEILLRRGVTVRMVRFTGANQVEIRRQTNASSDQPVRVPRSALAQRPPAEKILREAIVGYLRQRVPSETAWQVNVAAEGEWKDVISAQSQIQQVRGGSPPWIGTQWFEIILATPQGPRSLVVQAEVGVPPSVVVAARPIAKGTIIQAQDLRLQPLAGDSLPEGCFQQIEELVGKEALRGLPAGKPILQDAVHAPLLVQRGQLVTVYARAPGIRVRTQARAREDGSMGDLISVESLADRRVYFARVCGLQEAEVFARGVRTNPLPAGVLEQADSSTALAPSHNP